MQFEVRNLTSDEMEAAALISAQAFGGPAWFDIGPSAERARALYPPSDYIGTFEDNGKPIFLCGNAGNIVKAWSMFAAVFYLDIPATILIKRTSKAPDQLDQLVSWLEPFKAEMLGSGAVLIDATVPVEVAARSILKHIKAGS